MPSPTPADPIEWRKVDEVAQSRRDYEDLVNSINGIVWELDARTMRFTFVSHQAEAMLGYPVAAWLNDSDFWVGHMHLDDRGWAPAYCEQETRRKSGHTFEYRMLTADGRTVWLRDIVSVVVEDDEPVALRGVMMDVTDRKLADEALRASEERLREALLASHTGLWEWKVDTNEVSLSREWKRQLGYEPCELPDALETWESRLHPDDHARALAYAGTNITNRGGDYRQEFRLRHRDGSYRWIEAHASFVTEPDGRKVRLLGSHTDITDRKRAEEALRRSEANLAEAQRIAKLGSWELDVASRQLVWSDETYRIFEVVPGEFGGTYDAFLARMSPDDRALVLETYARSVESRTSYDLVHRLQMEDGRIKFVHGRCETHYAKDGTPVQSIGTVQDITVRTLAETERDELARRLLEAEENERRAIARDLHDEIGQSLTALKLSLQLAARAPDRTERLTDGVGIVDQILRQVRDLSLSLHSTALDDLGLDCALRGHAEQETQRAGLALNVEMDALPESLPHSIEIACFRIAQEALTNVIRHARARRVLLRLRHTDFGLELLVRDDGIGMAEPERVGSHSVGLAGMRERARLLGGAVRFAPAPDAGTDVVAILPLPGQITPSARSWSIRAGE
jgi:PAS domain S-box-containing protein